MKTLRKLISFILLVAVLIMGLLIGLNNSELLTVEILQWQTVALPFYQWLIISAAIGFFVAMFMMMPAMLKYQLNARLLKRQLAKKDLLALPDSKNKGRQEPGNSSL